jgi:hypothetical protein
MMRYGLSYLVTATAAVVWWSAAVVVASADLEASLLSEFRMAMLAPRQAGTNLQVFTGALGGVRASPIVNSGNPERPFEVDGDTFVCVFPPRANTQLPGAESWQLLTFRSSVITRRPRTGHAITRRMHVPTWRTTGLVHSPSANVTSRLVSLRPALGWDGTDMRLWMQAEWHLCVPTERCKSAATAATVTSFSPPVLVSSNDQFDFFCDV